jgi:molecular chaperone GrpE
MSEKPAAADEQNGAAGASPPLDDAERAADQVSDDLDELGEAKRERDEYLDLAQRTKADFDNYRKRVAAEAREAQARGRAELARELIPVLDNLERAVGAEGVKPDDGLARGVALVLDELRSTLERAGVQAYDPAGESFDPTWHEAISTRAGAEGTEPGVVLETVDRGYRLDGQVLRPARVIVSE